jgi:hypothetical protein
MLTELPLVMSVIAGLQLKMWNIVMAVKANGKLRLVLMAFMVFYGVLWCFLFAVLNP